MPTNNIKLFDENKVNMLTDVEYNTNAQRLNGVQSGVASSQLQNKTLYQTSLISYAIAQFMNEMGFDASDSGAVSTFVNNLSSSIKKPADSDVKYVSQTLTDAQKTQARTNINAAPGNFGFGSLPPVITDPDSLAGTVDGIYHFYNSDNPIEGEVAGILVHYQGNFMSVTSQSRQILYPGIQHNSHLERIFSGGWKPWEWVNPPMQLGDEYRTTERFNGKPVYAKLVDCGALPNNDYKVVQIGTSGLEKVIDASGCAVNSSDGDFYSIPATNFINTVHNVGLYVTGSQAIAISTQSDRSSYNAHVKVKYTKTTD